MKMGTFCINILNRVGHDFDLVLKKDTRNFRIFG